jgi:hypothetical protein
MWWPQGAPDPQPRGADRRSRRDREVSSSASSRAQTYPSVIGMKLLIRAAAAAGLAIVALVLVWRGGAAGSTAPECASSGGFLPQFCVAVPAGPAVRRETTVALASVASATADFRVEAGIPAGEALRVSGALDRASAQVERVFGRSFTLRPRVLLFATPATFAKGIEELFAYPPDVAHAAAASYGGIVDTRTLTVAVNFRATAGDDLPGLLAHELVHVMIRETAGADADLPAWFEEGFATLIQREDVLPADTDVLVARSLVANDVVSLADLATLADWHRTYARIGRPQYALAADAVRAMEDRVGEAGVVQMLAAVGAGERFADAFAELGGGTLAEFVAGFATSAATSRVVVNATPSTAGDVAWTIYGFAADAPVAVRISSQRGYDLTFMVKTDDLGMYRGSFGSTAPTGRYTIDATSGATRATAFFETGN